LILRKISKIFGTRCPILRLKIHQIGFRLRLCPRNPVGECTPDPLVGFKGLLLRGERGREEREGRSEEG